MAELTDVELVELSNRLLNLPTELRIVGDVWWCEEPCDCHQARIYAEVPQHRSDPEQRLLWQAPLRNRETDNGAAPVIAVRELAAVARQLEERYPDGWRRVTWLLG